jgi:hypothetical protein
VDRPPNDAAAKAVDPRRDGDRPAATRHALDGTYASADDAQHATPHRFDFGEFGHGCGSPANEFEVTGIGVGGDAEFQEFAPTQRDSAWPPTRTG